MAFERARKFFDRATRKAGVLLFDRRFKADTARIIELEDLGIESETAIGRRVSHQPSHWLALPAALRRRDVQPDDVFMDIGSGLGRVVLQAAEYPFKRVRGIEISEEINEVARRNVERNRAKLVCQDIKLVVGDAVEESLPDDVTVAFLYNPVRGELLRRVVGNMIASVDRNPRPLRVIYHNPTEHETLMSTGRARMVRDAPPSWLRKLLRISPVRMYVIWPNASGSAPPRSSENGRRARQSPPTALARPTRRIDRGASAPLRSPRDRSGGLGGFGRASIPSCPASRSVGSRSIEVTSPSSPSATGARRSPVAGTVPARRQSS